ncbi:MAG: GNAT family N-acetyltransferase [Acidobacteria bacterium]|nr:GNAT family N-acetyltransferase [Acidobacteriota bacterium]
MNLRIEPFDHHDVTSFDCGNESLDRWLRTAAANSAGHGTRVFLLVDHDHPAAVRVLGYFAVAPHYVVRTEVGRRIARGAPERIPAILLAKLALDRTVQRQGLGTELLLSALSLMVDAARRAGGRLILVDAIDDDAVGFYRHHDFEALPSDPRRLVIRISTVASALDLPWP